MPELLTTLGTAIDAAKTLRGLASKLKDAEAKSAIADLQLALVDLKIQLAEVLEENLRLRDELKQAESSSDVRDDVELRGGAYWYREGRAPEGRPQGPYCTRCVDVDGKLVLFQGMPSVMSMVGKYRCTHCDTISKG